MPFWTALIWFLVSLALLIPATRWLGGLVQGLVLLTTGRVTLALYLHFVLLLPGTVLHELSHWLTARLLGVRTGRVSLAPKASRKGGLVQFGAVQFRRTDPLRESLIGLAPLLIGSGALLGLAYWPLGLTPDDALELVALPVRLAAMLRAPDAWLWFYLLLAIANAMLPSASDRRAWSGVALYLALGLAILLAIGAFAHVPAEAAAWVSKMLAYLALALSLTLLLDLLLGAILWLVGALIASRTRIIRGEE